MSDSRTTRHRVAALLGASALALLAAPQAGAATAGHAAADHAAAGTVTATAGTVTASAVDSANVSTTIHDHWTGQCMDLPGYGSVGVNTPVSQYPCDTSESGDNQDFHLNPTRVVSGVQLYEVVNDKSGLCLDLPGYGSDPAGTHLYVYTCDSNPANDNQEWSVWNMTAPGGTALSSVFENFKASGSTVISPTSGGQCLDVSGFADGSDAVAGADWAMNAPLTIYGCYNSSWANFGLDDHLWAFLDQWTATP
ncbi:RICIN domain-containing protein [Catenulispora sp. NF23]|uniref:RICIN domain-containing protein n=1 Tax=Catenulispora pinistramenti TaxID=2705254 RepID=UPI001BA653ED|nr:RICIN domain-containing protein [Catenulispora pinistramenti]MBS2536521.1 RICIN domain-containing protein [Catenulispora pinistramenti]